ncbi:radical SAM family heme chaperone HemW [Gynuella sunshinyii]|nr:radical SAM family heme chaperone HemW [Gynuella sunshinyii]
MPGLKTLTELPPLSLYIHFPWCVRKCPYCDFNSHAVMDGLPEAEYIDALLANFRVYEKWLEGRELQSIFMGGGTPSLFSADSIARLLHSLSQWVHFSADCEITMEANPGTFEQLKFARFRQAGINRLSIGIQSFADIQLQHLGRIHSADEALKAVAMARSAGFDNLNIDLMHGLPGQTLELAMADLQQAIDLHPEHISWYQLTIEKNTEFFSRPPILPEDELLWSIQEQGQSLMAKHGYQQYEVSAYSLSDRQSRHNCNYWSFGDYIGIGAGAHGKLTSISKQGIFRTQETRLPKDYMAKIHTLVPGLKQVPPEELPFEFMMNILRLKEGGDISLLERRTGIPFARVEDIWRKLQYQGLVMSDRLATTDQGFLFLNRVLDNFLEVDAL